MAEPPHVTADFTATPLSGPVPLKVQFSDNSSGAPTTWAWVIGGGLNALLPDGNWINASDNNSVTFGERNPVFTFNDPGRYTVSLTAGNIYGSGEIVRPQYITVLDPFRDPDIPVVIKTGKRGYVEMGSIFEFTISDSPATIGINGGFRDLPSGATIRLVASRDEDGEILMDKGGLLKFSFPDIALYRDNTLVTEGPVTSIDIPHMKDFRTSMNYYLVPNTAYTRVSLGGFELLGDLDNAWIRVKNVGMNGQGSLRLIATDNITYLDGAANETIHDWIVE